MHYFKLCLSFFLHFRIPHFLKTACETRAERADSSALEIVHELLKVAMQAQAFKIIRANLHDAKQMPKG